MASFQVRFYERSDRGRLKALKVVELPGAGSMNVAVSWAAGVLERTTPELRSRIVELRVALVEAEVVVPVRVP